MNFKHNQGIPSWGLRQLWEGQGDALFNLVDAFSSEVEAHSFPEVSLSPFFERILG